MQALGNDVSSSAAVASYLGYLIENQEKHILGRGFFTIEKCYYCSYNAFRKMDMRVEITIPPAAKKHNGFTIEAHALDAIGTRHEVSEAFWKETHICAMLRLIDGPPATLRPIRVCYYCTSPRSLPKFIHFIRLKIDFMIPSLSLPSLACVLNISPKVIYFLKLFPLPFS